MNKYLKLLLCILLCQSAGIIGSLFTFSAIETWYATLEKPFFAPPNWVFGPVWTTLYTLMGISLFLVWGKKKTNLKWFWIQLGLNSLWSIAFFGMQNPLLAFGIIIVLVVSIWKTINAFCKVSKLSATLLYPYLAWVSFATILNAGFVYLNSL